MASGSATASEPQAGDNPQLDENRVHVLVKRMREEREARRRLDAEERPPVVPPSVTTLADRLAEPQLLTRWRIEGWLPVNSRVIVAAQYKAGKTTLVGNLVRSLVDGARWLDAANVTPIDGTVAIFDTEMSNVQLDRWLAEQGIQHSDRVFVATFRGRVVSLNLFDQPIRAMWAQCLRERNVRFLVLDCLRPLLDAFGLDEQRDAGRILVAFDALCEEARLTEAAVIQHMGHAGERSRGDSRLRDWPDVEWKLVRKDENPNSRRFISAYGRDVEVGESALAYDSMLHHLTLTGGGSRKESVVEDALTAIVAVLASAIEPLSARAIEAVLKENGSGHAQKAVREALVLGVRRAAILYKTGPKGAHLHSLASGAPMSGSPAETP
jgi:hypothetical protein